MMDLKEILARLVSCHGPAGDEKEVSRVISELVAPYCDSCAADPMGNLVCRLPGEGEKALICAHMDTVGMIVTHIEEGGFLRFGALGGLPAPRVLTGTAVRFQNGVTGTVAADENVKIADLTLADLYIDIGAETKEEAEQLVSLGDTAVYEGAPHFTKNRVLSPFLDNRISCAAVLSVLDRMGGVNDLTVVFSVQEELGLRGAGPAAYSSDARFALNVDTTLTDDGPGSRHDGTCRLGGGAAIKVMDRSVVAHPEMVTLLQKLAEENSIPAQTDVLRRGGTDAGSIQGVRGGVVTGGVSVPARYIHMPLEAADLSDAEAAASLILAFARADLGNIGKNDL